MNADEILSDLTSGINIKPTGLLRKGNQIIALPTAFGTKRRIHGCTKNLMVISYEWEKGAKMAPHDHDTEQITYVAQGKLKVTLGDDTFIAEKGDSYTEPSGISHYMEALEPSVTVESFSPPRPLFLILQEAAYHGLNVAYEGVKTAYENSKQQKRGQD
jgi:quercetin dioxygenase-like cupin family protein